MSLSWQEDKPMLPTSEQPPRLRPGRALLLWGMFALIGWLFILVPLFVAADHGPRIVDAWFGSSEAGADRALDAAPGADGD